MKKDTFLILIFFLIFNSLVPLFAQSSGMKDDWYSKSIAYEGDWSLIKKTFDKIEEKKQLTIGVIGGSITAGEAASDFGKTSWGPLVTQWFRREFPDTDISFYNAGIGATNSIFGAHRVDDDLLKHKPDLVIVEFSVNDMHTSGTKMSYESLIRKILNSEQKPAVLTLGLMVQTGENWQNMHLDVSRNYRVPYISYRDAIYPEVEKDNLTWRELSPDDVHPSDKGHQIIANLITHFLKKVCDSRNSLPEPITSNRYEHSYVYHFLPIENKDWNLVDLGWETSRKGETLEFEIEASNISIMYNSIPEKEKAPIVYLTVDGKKKKLNTYFENGWGEYMYTDLIVDESTSGLHTLVFEYGDKAGKRFMLHKILVTP